MNPTIAKILVIIGIIFMCAGVLLVISNLVIKIRANKHIPDLNESLEKRYRIRQYWEIAYYILCLAAIISAVSFRVFYFNRPHTESTISLGLMNIIKSNADTSTLPTFIDPSQPVEFSLGEKGGTFSYSWNDFRSLTTNGEKADPFNQFGITFYAYISGDKICVDTSLYGSKENSIVLINSNSLSPLTLQNWDDNHNNVALEIVDNNQKPVFQLIYETPFHIIVNGIFPTNNGILYASNLGLQNEAVPLSDFQLKPIFRYPSSSHLFQIR